MISSKIPEDIRNRLAEDEYMKTCVINNDSCYGRIEWHHALIYKGQRVNAFETILPACEFHHRYARNMKIKERFDWAMFQRGLNPKDYPKANLEQRYKYLKTLFK